MATSEKGSSMPPEWRIHPVGGLSTTTPTSNEALRRRAEAVAQHEKAGAADQTELLWPAAAQQALYELRVHQIELEMQNEELRRIQLELDSQRARYFDLYDLAPVGYLTVSAKGLILEANLTAANLLGVPRSVLVKQPLSRFIEKTDQNTYYLARKQLLETRQAQSSKLQMVTGAGTPFFARLMATVAQADGADVMRVLLADISERKRIEKTLADTQAELKAAQHMAHLGNWHWDIATDQRTWSEEIFRVFGVPAGRALANSLEMQKYFTAQSWAKLDTAAHQCRTDGQPYQCDAELVRGDGSHRWVVVFGEAVRDLAGNIAALHGTLQDITERKQIEEALRVSEERHRLIAEHVNDVIWTLSPQGKLTFVSPSVEKVRGFTSAQAMQQTMEETLSPASTAIAKAHFTQVLKDVQAGRVPQNLRGELEFRCKNGSTLWTEVMTTAVLDEHGALIELLGVSRDISERKQAEELVRKLAYYDPLTSLANRMLLKDRLVQSMMSGERSGNYGALLFLDLDNFKPLNDQHGHDVGDMLLAEVAKRLKSCVRQIDTVARFGGDEFVVLLEDLTSDKEHAHGQADLVAGKIRTLLAKPYVFNIASGNFGVSQTIEHKCTASIGVALFLGQKNSDDDILKWADLAMYNAKDAGRNTVCFCDAQMWSENTTRQVLEEDLRDAVLKKQICVYFQAQFDRHNQVIGADALLRWQHPSRGWVSPREFIPKAERTGLILPMGLWVLESACVQLVRWSKRVETTHLTVTVNVSGRQLVQRDFVEQVMATLERTGANPHRLKIEMKESVLLADVEGVVAKMKALKDSGVGFSLDDFGKGLTSLSDLNRLPLDQLKIDQDFVRDILVDPDDAAVAKMVLALADSLEVAVIAEGVETQAQRDFLAGLGCHKYQRYLFSPALPAHEFEALVAPPLPTEG